MFITLTSLGHCLITASFLSQGANYNFTFNVKFYPPDPAQLSEDITRYTHVQSPTSENSFIVSHSGGVCSLCVFLVPTRMKIVQFIRLQSFQMNPSCICF